MMKHIQWEFYTESQRTSIGLIFSHQCIAMLSNNIREGPCELAALYRSVTDLFE